MNRVVKPLRLVGSVATAPGSMTMTRMRVHRTPRVHRERWGGIVVSHNGIWRCLRRRGLKTPAKRLSLVAGYAAAVRQGCDAPADQKLMALCSG